MNEESPLTKRIRWVLTHAREAYEREEEFKRKWDALPKGAELHIQFTNSSRFRLAIARVGKTPAGHGIKMLHQELNTVIKHWPEPDTIEIVEERKLIPTDETGRYWLVTTMAIAKQLELFS
jgi:hypothetical protein